MNVVLYTNVSDNNVITKNLTEYATYTGTLRNESSVITPTLFIESETPIVANYARIPEFDRYYYITDVTSVRNNLWQVSFRVDVLMSFAQAIKQLPVIVSNAENDSERYLSGGQWVANVKSKTDIVQFSNGLNSNGEFILITAGGISGGTN